MWLSVALVNHGSRSFRKPYGMPIMKLSSGAWSAENGVPGRPGVLHGQQYQAKASSTELKRESGEDAGWRHKMKLKDERVRMWLCVALIVPVLAVVSSAVAVAGGSGNPPSCPVPEPEWFNLITAGLVPLGFYLGRRTWPRFR